MLESYFRVQSDKTGAKCINSLPWEPWCKRKLWRNPVLGTDKKHSNSILCAVGVTTSPLSAGGVAMVSLGTAVKTSAQALGRAMGWAGSGPLEAMAVVPSTSPHWFPLLKTHKMLTPITTRRETSVGTKLFKDKTVCPWITMSSPHTQASI